MIRRAAAALLPAVLLVLTGCATAVPGRPSPLLPPLVDAGDDEVPVVGAGDGPTDVLARNALADLETFWAEQFPAAYGEPFRPLAGGYFSVDPADVDPASYPDGVTCGANPLEVEDNAFYCDSPDAANSDSISYDRAFLGELAEQFGRFIPALVMAHEFGHAIQARVGFPAASILAETQADCLAGAWTGWVAARRGEHTSLRAPELDGLLRGYVQLRDPVGTSLAEESAHGSYFDRVSAFQEGFADGVAACRDNFGTDRIFTQQAFSSDDDLDRAGNAPYGELIDLVEDSLPVYWESVFTDEFGAGFEPPRLVPFDRTAPGCAVAQQDLVYCGGENLVGYDEADLTTPAYELGDFAVATAISIPYALAAREQLGLSTDDEAATRSAVCLSGSYGRAVFDLTAGQVQVSPGDIDESVTFLLEYGTDPRVLPDVELTGFELVDVYRTGFVRGTAACGLER